MKPRPNDLITVPACLNCNNHASVYDEKFRAYLGLHVAHKRDEAEKLFKSGALPSIRHNNTLKQNILKTIKPVDIVTKSGIFLERGASVLWDSEVHDYTIERLVRGLFFHHSKIVLDAKTNISVQFFKELPYGIANTLNIESIANGNFVYGYGIAEDCIYSSMWLFQFYNAHWAGGYTNVLEPAK